MKSPTDVAIQWFERVWNQKDPSAITKLLAPSVVGLTGSGKVLESKEFLEVVFKPLVGAFPDINIKVNGTIAQGKEVVVRWTATGTNNGPFAGNPASGLRVSFDGMTWFLVQSGRVIVGQDAYNFHAVISCLASGEETGGVRILKRPAERSSRVLESIA